MTTAIMSAKDYFVDGCQYLHYVPLYVINDNSDQVVLVATRDEVKNFGSRLTGNGELDAYLYSEFCQSIPHNRTIPMLGALDLDSLKTALENIDDLGITTADVWGVDETSLPTFGGEEPEDTHGVWSWDETRLLVGTCFSEIEIVPRPQ